MNANPRFRYGLIIALVLAVANATAQQPGTAVPGDHPIQVRSSLDVMLPEEVRPLLLDQPHVRFLVTVDEEGRLVDHLAVEGTHQALLPRAEQAVSQARFEAAVAGGHPVLATVEVRVTFFDPEQRALQDGLATQPFGSTSSDAVSRRIYAGAEERHVFRQSEPAELDAPLAVTAGKLVVLADDQGHTATGRCVVDYFVDHHGLARIPRIVSADNDTVARSALLTLQQLRFAPPTRAGQPTCVKVRQPFVYEGAPETAGGP